MKQYNYFEEMKEDVKNFIFNDYHLSKKDFFESDRYDIEDELQELLWINDNVTGNASGSYTFNTFKAKQYVLDNTELLQRALQEFDCKEIFSKKFFDDEWEWMDVTIRCYLLNEVISDSVEDILRGEIEWEE